MPGRRHPDAGRVLIGYRGQEIEMPTRPRKATAAVTKPDFASMLAAAQMPQKTVKVCMRADLVAEHEEADAALDALLDNPSQKFGGDGRAELRQQIEQLEAEMKANTYPFVLRGMPKVKWRALVAAHQPRRDEAGDADRRDAAIGVNVDTFFEAIIRACVVDPVLTEDQWRELLGDSEGVRAQFEAAGRGDEVRDGKLTDKQFDELSDAAWAINRRDVDVPFSRAVSRMNRISEPE